MKYFIANWKAHLNFKQIAQWIDVFMKEIQTNGKLSYTLGKNETTIILCPSFPFIPFIHEKIGNCQHIYTGSQDISMFDAGSYSGEVPAFSLANIIQYSIVGHSERRGNFHEDSQILQKKVEQCMNNAIEPVYCFDKNQIVPDSVKIATYEPLFAIGTGVYESPENVISVHNSLNPTKIFLYGGSVNETNASSYLHIQEVDGLLIGKASLDPFSFIRIILTQ